MRQSRHWHSLLRRARLWTTSADQPKTSPSATSLAISASLFTNAQMYFGAAGLFLMSFTLALVTPRSSLPPHQNLSSSYITRHFSNVLRNPACAQWCIFSIVRANFQKYDLYSAPIARALPRYIVPFFKFFKTGKCFKTMLFPVSCVSQKPLAFQKHSLLLIQPKTHAKALSERSEKCATVQVLTGTDSVARATYLQRAL